jgi:hypothetical protein
MAGVLQGDDEHRCRERGDRADSESKRWRFGVRAVGVAESEREHDERSRDRAGGDPGRQHSCREGDAALRVGAEDEQVGQVGAG